MILSRSVRVGLLSLCLLAPLSQSLASAHKATHHHASVHAVNQGVVDINVANVASLSSIKGIGVKKAQAIVAYRKTHGRFDSLASLANVKGISAKSIARWQKNNPSRLVVKK